VLETINCFKRYFDNMGNIYGFNEYETMHYLEDNNECEFIFFVFQSCLLERFMRNDKNSVHFFRPTLYMNKSEN